MNVRVNRVKLAMISPGVLVQKEFNDLEVATPAGVYKWRDLIGHDANLSSGISQNLNSLGGPTLACDGKSSQVSTSPVCGGLQARSASDQCTRNLRIVELSRHHQRREAVAYWDLWPGFPLEQLPYHLDMPRIARRKKRGSGALRVVL